MDFLMEALIMRYVLQALVTQTNKASMVTHVQNRQRKEIFQTILVKYPEGEIIFLLSLSYFA